jgi:hypothetical protein
MFEKSGFCYQGLSPKQIRIGRDLEEANMEALFGPNISKKGIGIVKRMMKILNTYLINLGLNC